MRNGVIPLFLLLRFSVCLLFEVNRKARNDKKCNCFLDCGSELGVSKCSRNTSLRLAGILQQTQCIIEMQITSGYFHLALSRDFSRMAPAEGLRHHFMGPYSCIKNKNSHQNGFGS